jgi:endonuclease/exonuclease/phosphatase family metal-dependent hydrolase
MIKHLAIILCCLIAQVSLNAEYRLHRIEDWNLSSPPKPNLANGEFKVAFWNFLDQFASDKATNPHQKYYWKNRAHLVTNLILRDDPDILGFCECNLIQADDLSRDLDHAGYAVVGFSSSTLLTIDEVRAQFAAGNEIWYSEFVGFIYRKERMELIDMRVHPLPKGFKHHRIITEGCFKDKLTGKQLTVLASHFDHLSTESIEGSGKLEIDRLRALEGSNIPWISVGDRNWSFNEQGELFAQEYAQWDFIREFRDDTRLGHFGPSGTFPGHLWLEAIQPMPVLIQDSNGHPMIAASTIDVGYSSKKHLSTLASYTLTGEFSPDTCQLLVEGAIGNLVERNFASDHFYIGGIFRFTESK